MKKEKTFAQNVIQFNKSLSEVSIELPDGFKLINPFSGSQKELVNEILNVAKVNELNQVEATYLTNARQIAKLDLAYKAICDAINSSQEYLPVDMVELDIKKAWDTLGEIIGIASGDELINELFSKFCLGK